MKAIGEEVRFRIRWWHGTPPRAGDALRTKRGRLYGIRVVNGVSVRCVVLPPDAKVTGEVFEWRWVSR